MVGMIEANADQKVEVRPRASGIVREVHAVLGQKVKKRRSPGHPGQSRDRHGPAQPPRQNSGSWPPRGSRPTGRSEIAANVEALDPRAAARDRQEPRAKTWPNIHHDAQADHESKEPATTPRTIERRFADKELGAYRGTLLQAFADYEIAVHEEEKNGQPAGARRSSASTRDRRPAHPRGDAGEARGAPSNRSATTPPRRSGWPSRP